MTQPKRSKNEMAEIVKLIHEAVPGDFVKVLGQGIQSIIDAELSAILGAKPYQRVEDRANYRNGYRVRKEPLSTGLGPVNLRIPKLRNGSYYPSILEQYQRVDRALISIISEAYFAGVSTRKMNKLFVDLGLENIDRSFVSRCAAQIDEEVEIWKNRQLDSRYAYIWLDAIYTKIRTEGRVNSTAVLIAVGVGAKKGNTALAIHNEGFHKAKALLHHHRYDLPPEGAL